MKKLNGTGKLALHRETIVNLTPSQLDFVVGGAAAAGAAPAAGAANADIPDTVRKTVSAVGSRLAPSWLRLTCTLC